MAKDFTKYKVKDIDGTFGKSKLVLAILKHYCSLMNPSFEDLKKDFPDELQGKGVFTTIEEANKIAKTKARHYVNDPIKIKNATIAVSTQWGTQIGDFISKAEEVGYSISTVEGGESTNVEESTDNTSDDTTYDLLKLAEKLNDKSRISDIISRAENVAEDFNDFYAIAKFQKNSGDTDGALKNLENASKCISGKDREMQLIEAIEDFGKKGELLLERTLDLIEKSRPKLDIPDNMFKSYDLKWGRYINLILDNGPSCDADNFKISLDMKDRKILGNSYQVKNDMGYHDYLKKWFDSWEVGIYDEYHSRKSYDGVIEISAHSNFDSIPISGHYMTEYENCLWDITCHSGCIDSDNTEEGQLTDFCTEEDILNSLGNEKVLYELFVFLKNNVEN